jgi:two-component system, OmpR family, sensor kinase
VSRLPIRVRLTLAFSLVMAVVLAAMAGFVYLRVGGALLASVDQTLRSQAAEAKAHARDGGGDLVDHDVGGGTTLAQVLDVQGRVLSSTPSGLRPLAAPADARRAAAGASVVRSLELDRPAGEWRVLVVPGGDGRIVAVARTLSPRDESLHRLLRELLLASPLALLLAAGAGYWLAAAALRPVEAMRRRAAAVSASEPAALPVPRARDEIARLAETLNEMLARLHSSFEHERRFVADASHELRTPLALLRAELEVALRRPRSARELEAALRSAAEETERLSRLAEDLLLIARADSGVLPIRREPLTVGELLAVVVDRFAGRASALGRTLEAEPSSAVVHADPERLGQALGNLVENALRHGAGIVTLFARERGGSLELHVLDAGGGFPPEFLPLAFDRFSRGEESRAGGGSGLGLSIVALIAAGHGGRAGAVNAPGGGADVWIELPHAEARARRPGAPAAAVG